MNQFYSKFLFGAGIKKSAFFLLLVFLSAVQGFAQPGKDGAITISTANTVINRYTRVTSDVPAGSKVVNVTNIAELSRDGIGYLPAGYVTNAGVYATNAIGQGDLIILYQAQGALIDATNTGAYGQVTDYNGAGTYELAYVESVSGNAITLGCGTKLSYFAARYVQVIRIPQYSSLTVDAGASVVAVPWGAPSFGGADPSALQRRRGGFVAAMATGIVNNGSINANRAGFRGGTRENYSNFTNTNFYTDYRSLDSLVSAEKGESIAGYRDDYDNLYGGRYGRGAAANGGGGGNSHNAGGGGGANGGNPADWFRGAGVMNDFSGTCGNPGAWVLDPNYIANGNALTNSAGGGSGGYTYGGTNSDACVLGPSYPADFIAPGIPAADVVNAAWGGDYRQALGGLGGRPIASSGAQQQIFFGGGGGAGDGNNGTNADGGDGGGIVFLLTTNDITGTGTIQANGENGANTIGSGNDAPGGGGGGGTVLIQSNAVANTITINANGGNGGNQIISGNESEGPGGGGGGGVIAVNSPVDNSVKTVAGGSNGRTSSTAITEFLADGATSGNTGTLTSIAVALSYTACETDLAITKAVDNLNPNIGSTVTFTITVTNNGPRYATNVFVGDAGATGFHVDTAYASTGIAGPTGWAVGDLAVGATDTLTVVATVNPTGIYTNTASIISDLDDPNLTNNSASVTSVPNVPPVAVNDSTTTAWNTNVNFAVAGNDTDADGTIDLASIDLDPATAGQQVIFTVSGQGTYTANADGTVTFDPLPAFSGTATPVNYTIQDEDGAISNIGTITVIVEAPVSIAGSVLNDGNGLTDDTVNGTGTNAGGLNAVLVDDGTGNVAAVTTVLADGTYNFATLPAGNYSLMITTATATVGNTPPAMVLPAGWVSTGDNLGTGTGSDGTADGTLIIGFVLGNISDAYFGIEQRPVSNDVTSNNEVNPGGTSTVVVPTLTGNDAEDGAFNGTGNSDVIVITTLPTNGILYYNGLAVAAGDTIKNYDPSLLTLDPDDGLIIVTFGYTEIDAALNGSATSATVTINFTSALPVNIISFKAVKEGNTALLKWSTAQEFNSSYFELQRSADGSSFEPIGSVKAKGSSSVRSDYQFKDEAPLNGTNFYRFKEVDIDGKVQYSSIEVLTFNLGELVIVYPNPVVAEATIKFSGSNWIGKTAQINVLTEDGKLVSQKRVGALSPVEKLNVGKLAPGSYIIQLITNGSILSKPIQVIRR